MLYKTGTVVLFLNMTALMSEVLCGSSYEEVYESKWKDHILSTKHSLKCKTYVRCIAPKLFEMIFDVRPEEEQITNLNNVKTHNFWRLHFSTKPAKEKFDSLYKSSVNNSDLDQSLSHDFNDFVSNITSIIGKVYFDSMKDLTFCKACSIEINKPLFMSILIQKNTKKLKFISI